MSDVREQDAAVSSHRAAIDTLMADEAAIEPPAWLTDEAAIDYEAERAAADADPEGFWAEKAEALDWIERWDEVLRFDPPEHRWFVGGKLNATVNTIDRHVHSPRRNKAALIWVGEDGQERTYTYNRLYREVNRFANALRRLGVGHGDRVILYMPLVPEGIIAMLASARIGAIHSVVYAGMGTEALRSRIEDAGAKVVVCSDYTYRRGKAVHLKPTVDQAVRDLPIVEHVIVHRRGSYPGVPDRPELEGEREHDFYDIQNARDIHCEPATVDAEDPLFILYTSGTTGKPKGVEYTQQMLWAHTMATLPQSGLDIGADDVVMPVVPMFHVNAWGMPFTATAAGAKHVYPGPSPNPEDLANLIEEDPVDVPLGRPPDEGPLIPPQGRAHRDDGIEEVRPGKEHLDRESARSGMSHQCPKAGRAVASLDLRDQLLREKPQERIRSTR